MKNKEQICAIVYAIISYPIVYFAIKSHIFDSTFDGPPPPEVSGIALMFAPVTIVVFGFLFSVMYISDFFIGLFR